MRATGSTRSSKRRSGAVSSSALTLLEPNSPPALSWRIQAAPIEARLEKSVRYTCSGESERQVASRCAAPV
jgi:hypothetical protein